MERARSRRRRIRTVTRDAALTRQGISACRRALDRYGLLLVQDTTVPSVTSIVVGEPVRGSWWAHALAHTIFEVLEELELEAAVVKLLAKKQTLIHRRLWPALVNVGNAHAPWQLDGLSARASELLELIKSSPTPVCADELALVVAKPAEALRELELRLLVITSEVHTESGRHSKAALSWPAWARERNLGTPDLRPPAVSRADFDNCVSTFAPGRIAKLLPWPTP